MSEPGAKVTISPENIEIIKEKYGLDEEGLKEVLGNVEVIAPMQTRAPPARLPKEPNGEISGENQLMTQLMHGDLSMAEVIMYMDMQDRRDKRERMLLLEEKRENSGNQTLTADDIGARTAGYLVAALQKEGVLGKRANTPEEKPEWAKEIEKSNSEILGKLRGDEENKKLTDGIEKGIGPMRTELVELRKDFTTLSKPAPEGTGPPQSKLEEYINFGRILKEAGIIQEQKSNIMLGPDGNPIPIKGEIPAALVYGPYLAEQIINTFEKAATNIGRKYGLINEEPTQPQLPKESIIRMPPKPAAKPVEPLTEAATEEVTVEEPVKPTAPIITMPQKPIISTIEQVEEEPEEQVEEEVIEGTMGIPCAQCGVVKELLPNGLCKPCATELAKEIKPHTLSIAAEVNKKVTKIIGPNAPEITMMPGIFAEIPEEPLTIEEKPEVAAPTKARKKAKKPKKKEKNGEQTTTSGK